MGCVDGCADGWIGGCDDVGGFEYDDVIGIVTAFAMLRFECDEVEASLKMYTCCGAVAFGKG